MKGLIKICLILCSSLLVANASDKVVVGIEVEHVVGIGGRGYAFYFSNKGNIVYRRILPVKNREYGLIEKLYIMNDSRVGWKKITSKKIGKKIGKLPVAKGASFTIGGSYFICHVYFGDGTNKRVVLPNYVIIELMHSICIENTDLNIPTLKEYSGSNLKDLKKYEESIPQP